MKNAAPLRALSDTSHHRRGQMLDRRRADLLHGGARFLTEDLEDPLDTRLTESAEAPQIGPSDTDGLCTHGQSLDDVRATAETAVHKHRHAAANRCDNFGQSVDCGASAIHDTSTMI